VVVLSGSVGGGYFMAVGVLRCSFCGDATLLSIFIVSCVSDYFCPYL
jgi:hypothetical protein